MKVAPYRTWIFDCDGVLLDSNHVKTEAFRELALPYGEKIADELVVYHQRTGGQSRFVKVRHLHERLLGRTPTAAEIEAEASRYGEIVRDRLVRCTVVPGARDLLARLPATSRKYVVSGGLESEVSWVLESHGLAAWFDGIYGSPRRKDEIFPNFAIGDASTPRCTLETPNTTTKSRAASAFLVFVTGYTEFEGWLISSRVDRMRRSSGRSKRSSLRRRPSTTLAVLSFRQEMPSTWECFAQRLVDSLPRDVVVDLIRWPLRKHS